MNKEELSAWIKSYEGFDAKPYIDSVGKLTIGYGRNIEDNGISPEEADYLFNNDLNRSIAELERFKWFTNSPDAIKKALINMNFQLGITRLLSFRNMINALIDKDYTRASIEALDSKWATQTPNRAKDIALMIREA